MATQNAEKEKAPPTYDGLPRFAPYQLPDLQSVKDAALAYQVEPKTEYLELFLYRFDKFLLYLIRKMKRQHSWLRSATSDDLYQDTIVATAKCMKTVSKGETLDYLHLRLKAYVVREILSRNRYLMKEYLAKLNSESRTHDLALESGTTEDLSQTGTDFTCYSDLSDPYTVSTSSSNSLPTSVVDSRSSHAVAKRLDPKDGHDPRIRGCATVEEEERNKPNVLLDLLDLTDEERDMVRKFYIEGYTLVELEQLYGVKAITIYIRMRRALRRQQDRVRAEGLWFGGRKKKTGKETA